MLYSIIYRYALFCFSSMHGVTGHNNIPKQAHEKESECLVMTETGLCKPWMPLKIKLTDKPRQEQHGVGKHGCKWKRKMCFLSRIFFLFACWGR